MRKLLVGVLLGLLAVIHSSPIDSMTQSPAETEEELLQEVKTDGFLVAHRFTTAPPKQNTTVQASQRPSLADQTEGSDFTAPFEHPETYTTGPAFLQTFSTEGSGFFAASETPETSTTIQASLQTFSTEGSGFFAASESPEMYTSAQTTFSTHVGGSGATESFLSSATDSPEPTAAVQTSPLPNADVSVSSVTTPSLSFSTTPVPVSTEQTVQSTTTQESQNAAGERRRFILGVGNSNKPIVSDEASTPFRQVHNPPESGKDRMQKGHVTPDWIIITAFVVALAALIAVCAAIATREEWNGPQQTSENKTNVSNQKRELEMQTFLPKEEPKVNGKDTEYTVIPLDDLPVHNSTD